MNNNHQNIKETFIIEGKKIQLTHLDKIIFPKNSIRKAEILEYYLKIAPIILPHYRDRPLTMVRFPKGIENKGFFQKKHFSYPSRLDRLHRIKETGGHRKSNTYQSSSHTCLSNQPRVHRNALSPLSG